MEDNQKTRKVKNGVWGYKEKCAKCGKVLDFYGYPYCDDCIKQNKEMMKEIEK